jgi:hypothetical protein
MNSKYIEYLNHLALSIDFISNDTLRSLGGTVGSFFEHNLSPTFYEFNIDGYDLNTKAGLVAGLKPIWTNSQRFDFATPRDENGNYSGFVMYCYEKNKPLWITTTDGSPLKHDDRGQYYDHWSGAHQDPDFASFWPYADAPIRTSICMPIRAGSPSYPRLGGFVCLEFSETIPFTSQLKWPLQLLADAAGTIFQTWRYTSVRENKTGLAIKKIGDLARQQPFLTPHKPRVFLAYSSRGEDDIVGVIRSVFQNYQEFELVSWKDISDSGDINIQVLEAISKASFGICYFSERSDGSKGFTDNLNVVFEAGMFQALVNEPTSAPDSWIPVREEASPRPPFDFAAERTIYISRDGNRLNREQLRDDLKRRIEGWQKTLSTESLFR